MKRVLHAILSSVPLLLGLFLGIGFIILPVIGCHFEFFPGDLGDGRFNMYILEHAHKFFTFQLSSFWDAPFMYPEKGVIAFSDNLLGSAPVYSFFRLLGLDREGAYQWWFLAISALNYIACYFFLKDIFKNRYAAAIGAFVFAFSMSIQSQMTHVQMFPRYAVPLALWMGLRFFREFKLPYFFLALLFTVYQIYCGMYLGFMLAFPVGVLLAITLISRKKELRLRMKDKKWRLQFIGSILLNILLLLPLLVPYMFKSGSTGYSEVLSTIPVLKSYFYSQNGSLLWGMLSRVGEGLPYPWNHQIFPGAVAMICMIVFVACMVYKKIKKQEIDRIEWIVFVLTAVVFIFYFRVGGISLYRLLHLIPGFSSIRCVTRIINIELLFFAFATAFVLKFLFAKVKKSYHFLLFLFLLGVVFVDNYFVEGQYKTEVNISRARVSELMDKIKELPEGAVISYEPDTLASPDFVYQLDAMLATQSLNMKCINAYTGSSPHTYTNFWFHLNAEGRKEWLDAKNYHGKIYIIK